MMSSCSKSTIRDHYHDAQVNDRQSSQEQTMAANTVRWSAMNKRLWMQSLTLCHDKTLQRPPCHRNRRGRRSRPLKTLIASFY